MSKIIVIGGGASGLISAIEASKNNEVIILEANDKCGKKILLTGNGRCNYWNSDININKYNTDSIENLYSILSSKNQTQVLNILEKLGIYPKIKNGYYYPYSNQASSVRTLLLNEIERRKIKVIYNFKVTSINKNNEVFSIKSNNNDIIEADKIILACGSCACPKTGSDGSGYELASSLGHHINKVTPSLVQLKSSDNCFKDWNGVRLDAKVSLYINGNKEKEDTGEIQLTDYGISGICTFNISGLATKNINLGNKVEVKINFLPTVSSFYDWFNKRNNDLPNYTIEQLLESIIPYKLMFILLNKANIKKDSYWNNLTENEKQKLASIIEEFTLEINGYNDFEKAQVATGGVPLSEINKETMESLIINNLYLVGELLDADGNCGGYNLAFAFISGYLAGRGI